MPGESALRSIPAEKRAEHEETGLPGPGRTAGGRGRGGTFRLLCCEARNQGKMERRERGSWKDGGRRLTEGERVS